MAEDDGASTRGGEEQKSAKNLGFYSVSSASGRPRKTGSFQMSALKKPFKRSGGRPSRYGLAAAGFLIAIFLSAFGGAWLESHNQSSVGGDLGTQKKIVTSQSQLISQIAKTVGPSVVSVNVNITSQSDETGFGLFGFSQPEQEQAAGTGMIISDSGLVLTNRHVVPDGTTSVSVTLSDGTELKNVSVIGRTSGSDSLDVAFLKIGDSKGHKLQPVKLGDSAKVQVGDDVVAIGNALGQFQNTVTSGIISGYGRSVVAGDSSGSSGAENLDNLFQTDAAINEGNSGGPLVNLNGQVIGMNTAIAGGAQNIGFAIPINDISGLIDQVVESGKFARPYLGVRYVPLTADTAAEYDLSVTKGAFVAPSNDPNNPSVIPGSPADSAGLQERDIITEVDGDKIDQSHSLISLLNQHQPGDKVKLTILRDDATKHISVKLGSLPSQ